MSGPGESFDFAVCLTHDVDRIYKTAQHYLYRLVSDRDLRGLGELLSGRNPYWQFERIMAIEHDLGVRSAFFVLDEQHLRDRPRREWLTLTGWSRYTGHYDPTDPTVAATLRTLAAGGWEIGLHGSFLSPDDRELLRREKARIETATGLSLRGNRQHYLNLDRPRTWAHLRAIGIEYDLSIGDRSDDGFREGYELHRPFDDHFVAFPWTVMDLGVLESADGVEEAIRRGETLLEEARDHRSVLALDWHQRVYHESEFPGWATVYRRLIERALEMNAWVGPPGTFYDALEHPDGTIDAALKTLSQAGTAGGADCHESILANGRGPRGQ